MTENSSQKISVTHLNIRQSIFILLFKMILIDLFAALLTIIFFSSLYSSLFPPEIKTFILSTSAIYFFALVIFKILLTTYVVLAWLNEYYEITPKEVTHKRGIIWKKVDRYPLKQIRLIKLHQSGLGKLFNFGTIEPFDWDLAKFVSMYLIHNPRKYMEVLESLVPRAGHEKDIL